MPERSSHRATHGGSSREPRLGRRRENLPVIVPRRLSPALAAACLLGAIGAPAPAQPLYKLTAPDGTVTYTDRPPPGTGARIEPIGRGRVAATAPVVAVDPALPLVLREAATKFPVVLYTIPDCAPCDRGRELLKSRGVPYRERRGDVDTDRDTWTRAAGAPDAPVLTVGGEHLRGYTPDQWQSTLDLAGYPRDSRLPAGFPAAPVTPLVDKRAPTSPARAPAEPASPPPPPVVPEAPASGIRF